MISKPKIGAGGVIKHSNTSLHSASDGELCTSHFLETLECNDEMMCCSTPVCLEEPNVSHSEHSSLNIHVNCGNVLHTVVDSSSRVPCGDEVSEPLHDLMHDPK